MTKLPLVDPAGGPPDGDAHPTRTPDRAVEYAVLAGLGRPPGLYGVAVRPLWENRFRVNVLVGSDLTTVRIAHSYFVEAGQAGDILSAVPRITRQYA
jgi:hypothetical protein